MGCGDGVHESGEAECAERLPCSCRRAVPNGVPELERFGEGLENPDGTIKEVATAKMVNAMKGKSRMGASVSINFSKEFAMQVSWQKVDAMTGAAIDEEDITDNTGGDDTGGGTTPPSGGGDLEP